MRRHSIETQLCAKESWLTILYRGIESVLVNDSECHSMVLGVVERIKIHILNNHQLDGRLTMLLTDGRLDQSCSCESRQAADSMKASDDGTTWSA